MVSFLHELCNFNLSDHCGVVGSVVASCLKGCGIDSALGPITTVAKHNPF